MQFSMFSRRTFAGSIFLLAVAACGNSDDNDSASIRFLNATSGVGTLDLYTDDDKRASNIAPDTVSDYATASADTYDTKVKRGGSDTSLLSNSISFSGSTHYTVVAWGREGAVKLALIAEEVEAPSSGIAKVRVFNAATDAGPIDMYLTDSVTTLDNATANATNTATGTLGGFAEVGKGSYRLRITGSGQKDDIRLDIPAITLASQDRATIVLQSGPGGVLVHSLLLIQQGSVTVNKNTNARARVVASVNGNGVVTASVGGVALGSSLTSPGVASYVLVPAGSQTLLAQSNGATISSASTDFFAGADYSVFIYGNATLAQMTLISDDNKLPSSTTDAKMRLANGAEGYNSLSLALNSVSVSDDVALGTASSFSSVSSNSGNALVEVTSPLSNTPLYTTAKSSGTTGVNVDAQGVYTVFMLGGNATPRGVLRKER